MTLRTTAQTSAGPAADQSPGQRRSPSVRLVLVGILGAMLLAMLDNLIVGTAMPTIVSELGGSTHLAWVVIGYTLATAVSTPVWGKAGDLRGRKALFLLAIGLFMLGSVASGASQSMGELVGFRVVQGLGAGGIAVTAFALVGDLVPPRERGRYQGMIAVVVAIGTIGGPLLGGFVTGTLGWRWAFYINIPLGLFALGWCALFLHVPVTRRRSRIDVAGIATLALTITSVVLLTTWAGSQYPWLSLQIVGLAVLAMGSAAAFARAESRTVEPVLPLRLFVERSFTSANVLAMVVGAVMFGSVLYLPLFQQSVQGATAASSGLLLLPLMVPVVVVTTLVGRTMSATGRYKIFPVIGTVLIAAAAVGLSTMTVGTSRFTTAVFMAVLGVGMGCVQQMTTVIAQNSAPTADLGAASSAVAMSRTIGASVGVAVFGSLFTRATLDQVAGSTGYLTGVASGTHGIFLAAAVLGVVGVVAAVAIVEVPLRSGPAPQEPHQGQASTTPAGSCADLRLTRPAPQGGSPPTLHTTMGYP